MERDDDAGGAGPAEVDGALPADAPIAIGEGLADEIDGERCFRSVADLPPDVAGAIVMVSADRAAAAVQACIDQGICRIWLHKGAGPSSVSDEAVALCHDRGVSVIDGECPLMFVEPAAAVHRIHRFERKLTRRLPA